MNVDKSEQNQARWNRENAQDEGEIDGLKKVFKYVYA